MLTELRTLIAVARHGTFAAAGDRIGLTQAAVSGHIKRLEDQLGHNLFDRTGRAAILNGMGRTVLARAEALVALADTLTEPLDLTNQTGRLRVGAINSVQPTMLRRVMARYHAALPRVRIEVMPGTSMELLDKLDAGQLDMAVVIKPAFGLPPALKWQPLLTEPFVVATQDGSITDWREAVQSQPFIRYNRKSFGGRQVERYLEAQGLDVADWAELDDIPAILAMVADGLGVSILPQAEAYAAKFANVHCLPLGDTDFRREIGVITPLRESEITARFREECARDAAMQ
ncbi:LysR family transcriptional regulator [Donghicola sp. C2-DW-16]|uniref:LysR family transcriptional regulator n=1 Tax=Donghicola mangrovi TaxID=2729614 RepID=A0ABX2PFB2_9RHOB|nr:LysR family transcriptional regulator [Donghicola mangrovi]NVO28181.1 LysR family transcriptional regulator [Donghicola mangrovi]